MTQTTSQSQTKKLAKEIAKGIPGSGPVVFGLEGELGAGKTTFVQGFAKALGIKEKVLSPTFLILKEFNIPNSKRILYHIDCYRIEGPKDILQLGWKDIVNDKKSIVMIEWPERIKEILPKNTKTIRFTHNGGDKRTIEIT